MSHTNSTTNYELSQFLGSDKPAWLVDYNGDMLKIDNQMKANADAAAEVAGDVAELQAEIGSEGLTGRITQAENDIDALETAVGSVTLPTTAQTLTGAIAELKGVNDDQTTAIGNNATAIAQVSGNVSGVSQLAYTIANVYDSTATYAIGDYAINANTLYKCTTAIAVGETFDPSKWTSVKVMDEMPSGGGGTSYTAGDGIDITSNIISFDGDTASYDNTSSGLTATNIQDAIDELAGSGSGAEVQTGTLTTGQTSVTLTFTNVTIGSTSLIDVYTDTFGVNPTNVTYTASTVVLTFDAQASDIGVAVKVMN